MKKRMLLKVAALLMVLLQLTSLMSGCLLIRPDKLASLFEEAVSGAFEGVSVPEVQESSQQSSSAEMQSGQQSGESSAPEQQSSEMSQQSSEAAQPAPAAEGEIDPLFWEVSSDSFSGKVYLFGSIHAAREDAYPLPEHIRNAFDASDALAVECDTIEFEKSTSRQIASLRAMAYLDGTTIADHISPENYEKAVALLTQLDAYVPQYDIYKPCMWTSAMDSYIIEKAGLSYDFGLDNNLMQQAKSIGKQVLEIESVEFQYGMLGGFSDGLQELMLEDYLYDGALDEQAEGLKELYEEWSKGNASALIDDADEDDMAEMTEEERALYVEYNTQMLTNRNARMADAAESYMRRGMKVFLVVGSAHMVGDEGIVKLLRDRGFTVTEYRGRY